MQYGTRRVSSGPQWQDWSTQFRGECPTTDPRQLEIWGYTGQPSYSPGDTLTLHVSTTATTYSVRVIRDGVEPEVVAEIAELQGHWHEVPSDVFEAGCAWPVGVELPISADWRSGGYLVEFIAVDERGMAIQDGFFVLKAANPGVDTNLAMIVPTYTWQAYNDWGGGSAYSRDSTPDGASAEVLDQASSMRQLDGYSPRLSVSRPWARGLIRLPAGAPRYLVATPPDAPWAVRYEQGEWAYANGYSFWCGMAGWDRFDGLFVKWAERQGIRLEMLSQWDLDQQPGLLDVYDCVITVGHDEYWTANGRRQLDDFISTGGKYARFAGNIFWQIRVEDGGATQVCYKYAPEADPHAESADRDLRTGPWESLRIGNPAVTTFGANGARGAYARLGGSSPRGVGGFIVYRNDHWVFEGTDLYYGDVLGSTIPLVAYEVDGVSYTFRDGLPYPTGEDGAPDDLEILALTPGGLLAENHQVAGSVLLTGDGDLAFMAEQIFGEDNEQTRSKIRYGAGVITVMDKGAGQVFCGGTTEWPYGLFRREPLVERVVSNVLKRFTDQG